MEMRNQFGDNDTDGGGGGEQQCRACLVQHSKHHVYSMDSKNHTIMDDGSEETIAEIYHQCTQLLYDPADCHYNWICQYCIEKMVDFVQFRKMCINSYNTLKQASQTVTMTKNNSLKVELMDEYDDAATCGMEMDHTVAIKQEASFDCNASQSKDQNHEFNPNDVHMDGKIVCVGWEMPLPQAAANAQVQAEKHVNETEDGDTDDRDTDFVGFGDTSDDSSDSDDMAENKATNKKQLSARNKSSDGNATKAAKTAQSPNTKGGGNVAKPKNNEPPHACDKCPRRFFKLDRYNAHMRRHMGLKAYKCEQCDKEFQKVRTLKSHMEATHYDESKGQPKYTCDVDGCGKIYTRKESLRTHIQLIHVGRKPVFSEKICEQCGKTFKNNAALTKHTYTHTKITPFKCDTCSKMFATAHKLKEHVMRHKGIKNFCCSVCGLRKTTGHELRVHMRIHSDVQYPCEMCSSVFSQKDNMKRHMRVVHCGVKAYKCPHCDQSFGKAETRKHHVMTHTGEKPHVCAICDKRFIQSVALKAHMKVHNKK